MNVYESAPARLRSAIDMFGESFRRGNPFVTIIETQVLWECERKVDALLLFRETVKSGSASALRKIGWSVVRGEKRVIDFCLALVRISNRLAKAEQLGASFHACCEEAESALNEKALSDQRVSDLVEQMRASIKQWRNAHIVASHRIVSLSRDLKHNRFLCAISCKNLQFLDFSSTNARKRNET